MRLARWEIRALIALLLLLGGGHLATLRSGHPWGDDFAQYLAHARNLAGGRPYGDTGYIPNPAWPEIGPPSYPRLFPMLLAPVWRHSGLDLEALKLPGLASLLAAVSLLHLLARESLGPRLSLAVAAALGGHPYLLEFKNHILSELPFLALLLGSLLAARLAGQDGPAARRLAAAALAGLVAGLAAATRSVGLVLMPVLALAFLARRRRDWALVAAAAAGFGLVHGLLLPPPPAAGADGYLAQVRPRNGGLLLHLYHWIAFSMRELAGAAGSLLGVRSPAAPGQNLVLLATILLGGVAVTGLLPWRGNRHPAIQSFLLLYLLALLAWGPSDRLLLPLLPFLLWGAARMTLLAVPPRRTAAVVVGALLLPSYVYGYMKADGGAYPSGPHTPAAQELFAWLRREVSAGGAVAFAKPRVLALFTGLRSAALAQRQSREQKLAFLQTIGATHLVVGPHLEPGGEGIEDFARAEWGRLKPVFFNGPFLVLRLPPGGPAPPLAKR